MTIILFSYFARCLVTTVLQYNLSWDIFFLKFYWLSEIEVLRMQFIFFSVPDWSTAQIEIELTAKFFIFYTIFFQIFVYT